jgi:thioredoxin-dependent peroxiredoxin
MLPPGKKPNLKFEVEALVDGKVVKGPFADLIAGSTVVSVWMRNNTSACDRQSAELGKAEKAVLKAGYRIIGVSRDGCGSHAKYAAKHGYRYTLVADPDDRFSRAVDALVEKSMYGRKYVGPARAAYVLDGKGKLVGVIPKVEAASHGRQVLEALAVLER